MISGVDQYYRKRPSEYKSPPLPSLPLGKEGEGPPLRMKPLSPPLLPPENSVELQKTEHDFQTLEPLFSVSESSSTPPPWSVRTAPVPFLTDSEKKSSTLLDRHERFKPEKNQRRGVQKMKWTESRQPRSLAGDLFSNSPITSMEPSHYVKSNYGKPLFTARFSKNFMRDHLPLESESRVSSMTIADVSPRLAVKKVLLLYEQGEHREAANLIQRLSVGTFRIILRELPVDILIEALPHSLPILEALYSKVFDSDGSNVDLKPLKPQTIILHMVKFFSQEDILSDDSKGLFNYGCKRILRVIITADPKMIKWLERRRRALEKAVEGMGQHGHVGTAEESLLPLHDALKLDFQRVVDAYKGAVQKLEELSLANRNQRKHFTCGPAPIQASHQRQLSLRAKEIEERLIKNKSLLNVVEPTLDNHCLDILLGILQRRIDCDKDALFQFTQLKKEAGEISSETQVAPLLLRYSRGCKEILDIMREIAEEGGQSLVAYEEDSSDLSGYHSDSDSAIMTSGNSPFVSPRARFNFLSRSVRCKTLFRPSIISTSSTSGLSSGDFCSGSILPDPIVGGDLSFPTTRNQPMRPRHVKHRNQIHKNNSLVSSISSVESESSGSVGSCEEFLTNPPHGSVEYVTVVSVPDNQVMLQKNNNKIYPQKSNGTLEEKEQGRIFELKNEINSLKQALHSANFKINQFQLANDKRNDTIQNGKEERMNDWIRQYGALYATARVETMDALDEIPELASADELKSKLLFSVVVLSFRSANTILDGIIKRVSILLQMDTKRSELELKVFESVREYLGNSVDHTHVSKAVEQVTTQLWSTLYDYPSLRTCSRLLKYINSSVQLAWGLANLNPSYRLEYELRTFQREFHVRVHSSNPGNDTIRTYLWPALVNGGTCIHKGVVLT